MAFSLLARAQRRATPSLASNLRRYATEVPTSTIGSSLGSQAAAIDESIFVPLSPFLPRRANEPRARNRVVSLDRTVFHHPIRRDILHLCAVHHLDGLRQGSASTKTRGEVAGSGRKIRPQKGSGRARLGDKGSPMLRGGGRAFGPKPRDFSTKLPRKVIQMGMRVALSAKLKERFLGVVETLDWRGKKTSDLAKRMKELPWGDRVLLVTGEEQVPGRLDRCSGNIPTVDCMLVQDLTVYDVLKAKRLVLDVKAVEWLEQALTKRPLGYELFSEADALAELSNEEMAQLEKEAPQAQPEAAV